MNPELSVIVPVFNEERNIPVLYDEISLVLKKLKKSYEIVFVNDGSTDKSLAVLKKLKEKDKNVRIINFYKNFGQSSALSAGFEHCRGKTVVTMDADLQNDPADIPKLLENLDSHDVVVGWRFNRKDPILKKVLSRVSNFVRKRLIKEVLHDAGCTLRAYRGSVVKDVKLYGEMHRYLTQIIKARGYSVTEIKVNHRDRKFGKTKYNYRRIIKGLLDLIYVKFWSDYSTRPLHFFGALGIFQYIMSFLILIEQVIKAFYVGILPVGPLLLLSVLLIITGTIFVIFGFLFEIQIRTYYESHDTRPYNIKEII